MLGQHKQYGTKRLDLRSFDSHSKAVDTYISVFRLSSNSYQTPLTGQKDMWQVLFVSWTHFLVLKGL